MLQFSRDIDLEMAEALVQDAFYSALSPTGKIRVSRTTPAGWVYKVCRNNAINARKAEEIIQEPLCRCRRTAGVSDDSIFDDPKMQLLFACAHPRLSSKTQVVITLKYVANLKGRIHIPGFGHDH